MDRGAWQPIVHGVTELDMTEQLTHIYGMFGRTNAFCFFKKQHAGEDFKAGEQPWNIPHLPAPEQLLRGLRRVCGGGVPERGEHQEPDFLQLHFKMEMD